MASSFARDTRCARIDIESQENRGIAAIMEKSGNSVSSEDTDKPPSKGVILIYTLVDCHANAKGVDATAVSTNGPRWRLSKIWPKKLYEAWRIDSEEKPQFIIRAGKLNDFEESETLISNDS